jgi:hypothetical protein
MHIAIAFVALWLIAAASQASAQPYPGVGTGPKLGELEIKAYQKIPKDKVAVQLTADNHLSRELRRQVMIRLSQRGNEVGFSGGNVMRMDVTYFDLLGGNDRDTGTIGGWPDYAPPGSNPRPALPSNPVRDGGKVLWTASGSCTTQADKSQLAGEAIINHMFNNADKNMAGDAGCPL